MFNSNPYINAALGIAMALFASGTTAMPMYHLLTETDPGQITNNLVLSQFDTLTDLINFTPAGTSGLASLPGAVSAAGLAFDGNQYLLLTETDPGQITNNLVLSQFDTLTDLINLTPAGTSGLPSLPGAVSARGLVYVPDSTVPEPATIMLYATGLAGLGIAGRGKTT